MQLLDAVNLTLPKLGEHPVTRLDIKHPTLAVILPEVENTLRNVLLRGWWFNEFEYTAYPDIEGKIALGTEIMEFIPTDVDAVQRGRSLYNPETLSYVWDGPVKGRVTQYVPFNDLPEAAQQYIYFSALINVYVTDIGVSNEISLWQTQAAGAYSDLLAIHLRHRKYTTRKSARFGRIMRALRS